MRKLHQTVADVPHLLSEWDEKANAQNGMFPHTTASQSNQYAHWICRNGHKWSAKVNNRYNGRNCPECNKRRKTSFPEQAILFYVKQFFVDAINSYTDIFDNHMELDVFIPSLSVAIEYDGIAWHSNLDLRKEKLKYQICKNHGIKLIRFKESIENILENEIADMIIFVEHPFTSGRNHFSYLDKAICELLSYLSVAQPIVDTKKDKTAIYENYLTILENTSLQSTFPELAAQWHPTLNGHLTPSMFMPHSSSKVWWLAECGHTWNAQINVRTRGNGCPYCAGQKVLKGFNDLKTVYPDIAAQWHPTLNGSLTPEDVTFGSNRRVYWLCAECKQEWKTRISMRTCNNRACPYCAHILPINGTNDLATSFPDLIKDWDFAKNKGIDPSQLLPYSNKQVWWKCHECGYEFRSYISNRTKGTSCPKCSERILIIGKNDLETLYSDIAKEWDYNKNDILPSMVLAHSNIKYHWVCSLGHSWKASPNTRTSGRGCPVCSGNKVLEGFNDLYTTHPDVAAEWHPTLNGNLKPTQVSKGRKHKVWFLCPVCKNGYEAYVYNKINGYAKCPFCSQRKTRAKYIIQLETGKKFHTLKEAAQSLGKNDYRLIQMCCKGRCSTAYGYHWEYRTFPDE